MLADEKPVARVKTTVASGPDGVRVTWCGPFPSIGQALYTHPAPAAPKEHPCNSARNLS
jgi:hypothetical protein